MKIHNLPAYWAAAEQPDLLVFASADDVLTSRARKARDNAADKFSLTVVMSGSQPSAGANKVVAEWDGTTMTADGAVVWAASASPTEGLLRALVEETVRGGALEAIGFERLDDLGIVVALIGDHPDAVAELRKLDREAKHVVATCHIAVSKGDANEGGADVTVEHASELAQFLNGFADEIASRRPAS